MPSSSIVNFKPKKKEFDLNPDYAPLTSSNNLILIHFTKPFAYIQHSSLSSAKVQVHTYASLIKLAPVFIK